MNILFISNYRSLGGWGEASRGWAHSLLTTDLNVTLRPIYMSGGACDVSPLLKQAENNKSKKYDVLLTHVLPNLVQFPTKQFPCVIDIHVSETSHFENSSWIYYLNKLNKILVPSLQCKNDLIESGLTKEINIILEAFNLEEYNYQYDNRFWKNIGLHDNFNFLSVGEWNKRKNFEALLIAFHTEFKHWEPVQLVIKTNIPGLNPEQSAKKISGEIENLKKEMGLTTHRPEILISEYLPKEQLNALYQISDCTVFPSFGEATNRNVVDSMGFECYPIVTKNTGMESYVDSSFAGIINSIKEPVLYAKRPVPNLYSSQENWHRINILELMYEMRKAYEMNKLEKEEKQQIGRQFIEQFNYKNVGKKLQKCLNI